MNKHISLYKEKKERITPKTLQESASSAEPPPLAPVIHITQDTKKQITASQNTDIPKRSFCYAPPPERVNPNRFEIFNTTIRSILRRHFPHHPSINQLSLHVTGSLELKNYYQSNNQILFKDYTAFFKQDGKLYALKLRDMLKNHCISVWLINMDVYPHKYLEKQTNIKY